MTGRSPSPDSARQILDALASDAQASGSMPLSTGYLTTLDGDEE